MSEGICHILEVEDPKSELLYQERKKKLEEKVWANTPEVILWEATRACDLRCIHCGSPADNISRNKELTTEEVINLFYQIKKDFDINKIRCISITGGEPTIRNDLIEIVSEIKQLGFDHIVMHSNGHKIAENADYLEALLESGITGIGVNLDGLKDTHNYIRKSSEAYDLSMNAAQKILNHKDKINTMISTVVTKLNIGELSQLRKIVQELSPQRWRLISVEPIGRAPINIPDALLDPEDIEHLLEFIIECRAEEVENPDITQTELGCGQWYGKELEGLIRPYIWHCIAGINTLGIHYDGSIAACNNINSHFIEGNIRDDNVREVWERRYKKFREYEWKRNGECLDCSDWGICHGGDMHRRHPDGSMIGKCFFRWLTGKYCNN